MEKVYLKDLVATVAGQVDMPKSKVQEIVQLFLTEIKTQVDAGVTVGLSDFGTFRPTVRAARKGRNPKTGEPIDIGATRSVVFSKSRKFYP